MEFVAIDVETANHNRRSICAIGIVRFNQTEVTKEWCSLINPQDGFDKWNTRNIHGISEKDVRDAPTFPVALKEFKHLLENNILVAHSEFDQQSLRRAAEKYSVDLPDCQWVDSEKLARRAWPDLRDHKLPTVCKEIGYEFQHHNALEDAKAAGQIVLAAMAKTGMSLEELLAPTGKTTTTRRSAGKRQSVHRDGNPNGPLFGNEVVFTGTLSSVRREAADLAASAGCKVAADVRRSTTTILVVGDVDIRQLAGHDMSAKHRKALSFKEDGAPIEIVGETDFLALVALK